MTAPLEMLRKLVTNPPVCRSSPHKIVAVTVPELCAAIAAIEERDAKIERLTRDADDARAIAATFDSVIDRCGHALETALGGDGDDECSLQDVTDAVCERIATLTRQLAEMDRESSVQRERANGLEYACECAERQRDAMRGALKEIVRLYPPHSSLEQDARVIARRALGAL